MNKEYKFYPPRRYVVEVELKNPPGEGHFTRLQKELEKDVLVHSIKDSTYVEKERTPSFYWYSIEMRPGAFTSYEGACNWVAKILEKHEYKKVKNEKKTH